MIRPLRTAPLARTIPQTGVHAPVFAVVRPNPRRHFQRASVLLRAAEQDSRPTPQQEAPEAPRTPQTPTPPKPSPSQDPQEGLSVWPFLVIFIGGFSLFALSVRSQEGKNPRSKTGSTTPNTGEYVIKKSSKDWRKQEAQKQQQETQGKQP